ncbi:MAG: SdrD B-like domain-containing protein [Rhodoferax sp.]
MKSSLVSISRIVQGLLAALSLAPAVALAALGASVTLVGPDPIFPGESTSLRIQLSNSAATPVTGVAFPAVAPLTLPGTLPDGLRIAGAASYTCTDPNGNVTTPGAGSLSATVGSQVIALSGGSIPAQSGGTDGTCVILVPVTAGSSNGALASYAYTLSSGGVTGTDGGGAVANVGTVTQTIGVRGVNVPAISKSFTGAPAVLGGAPVRLSITVTNPNGISLPQVDLSDVFPLLGGTPALRVAATPNAQSSCSAGGTPPAFSPAAGAFSVSATGGTVAPNGSCTIAVDVVANTTNGAVSALPTNTVDRTTQFSNGLGLVPAQNASASVEVRSPLSVAKSFSSAALASGQAGSLTITLSNSGSTPLTVTTFDDTPIDGLGNPASGLKVTGQSTTCAGGVASAIGNVGVRLTGGSIPAGSLAVPGSCSVTVNFTATVTTPGVPVSFTNSVPTGAVGVTTPGIVSAPVSASLLVVDDLRILKTASPADPAPGNPVRYEVTVQNFASAARSDVSVTDVFANGQTFLTGTIGGINYTPTVSAGCGAVSTTAVTGAASATLTFQTLPARISITTPSACTVSFWAMTNPAATAGSPVTNSIADGAVSYPGIPNPVSGAVSTPSGTIDRPVLTVSKGFTPGGPLSEGSITRLRIVLTNRSANPLSNVSVSDPLPTNGGTGQMRIASPANAATSCGPGVITAVPGSSSITMNGATVPARANSGAGAAGTCTLQVDVIAPAGSYANTVSAGGTETLANGATRSVDPVTGNAAITFTSAIGATKSFSPATVSSGGRSTVTVRVSNAGAVALTNLALTDTLPAGMVLATPPAAYSTCAGTPVVTGAAGAGSIALTGASLAGGGSCDLVFDVVATGGAAWTNTIPAGGISADGGVVNTTAVSAVLGFAAPSPLTVAKATNPGTLTFPGQVSRLTVVITGGSSSVSGMALTDHFTTNGLANGTPNGMVIAPTPAASTTCPGGVVTAVPGGTSLGLSVASLANGAQCAMSVNVTSTAVGGITNLIPTNAITTDQGLSNAGPAQTSLSTQSNLGVTKNFTPLVVKPGERTRLRISFFNATALPLANLAVTDNLPAGLTVPVGANPTSTCLGATISAPTPTQVQVSGASVPAASGAVAASCFSEIDVLVSAQGDYVNTIGASSVTGTSGGIPVTNSQPATDTVRGKNPLVLHKALDSRTLDAGNPDGFTTGTASQPPGSFAVLTIRISNPNTADVTSVSLRDTLPAGLVVATPGNGSTTCTGGLVTAPAAGTSVRLSGATIPAGGACTVSVRVLSNIPGSYVNTIPAGAVSSAEGVSNEEPTQAQLTVSTPPSVTKQFAPPVIAPGAVSRLTIFLNNGNAAAATLTAPFTDNLPTAPGSMVVAAVPNVQTNCGGGVGAVSAGAGDASVTYASGQAIPPGGCTISLDVTASVPGSYANSIPAGALQTTLGTNQAPANATLAVSTQGFISGRVFHDNNPVPNGVFNAGTDTPIPGVAIELRSGATCTGALVASTTTDAAGNYLFAGLAAGTYSVCEPVAPSGTLNGTTTAGPLSPINGSTGTPGSASNPTPGTSQITGIVLNTDGAGGETSGSANNNFAEILPSTISGRVFLDQNNNGVQNGADSPLAGVPVELLDGGGTVVATTTTGTDGTYSFPGLLPGTYSVREPTQPTGTSSGLTVAGSVANGGTAGTPTAPATTPSMITGIVLPPNTTAGGNNFAELPNGRTLSGRVFADYDNNGSFDPTDNGLGGQTVTLTGTDLNGNPVSISTQTLPDGTYTFTGVPPGTSYTVTQPTQPPGTTNGITTPGSTGGVATPPATAPSAITGIDLSGPNTVSAGNNFAEVPGLTPDLRLAKTHTPGSFAQGSVTGFFTLTPSNIGAAPTSGTVTVVDTLPTGMSFIAASGTGWTCAAAGAVITCTSTTAIPATGTGNPIRVRVAVGAGLAGQVLINNAVVSGGGEPPGFAGNNSAVDPVAIDLPASVSGSIWRDSDHDRIKDAGEPVVPGWTVELRNGGVVVATTTTNAQGAYRFDDVAPGAGYQIAFREPGGGTVFGRPVPNETGIAYTNGVASGTVDTGTGLRSGANPGGASNADGTLSGLTLMAGTNTVQQSLPLDPAGVVYDAITRQPVQGAVVTITGPGGFNPATDLAGGSATSTTGADGFYQFLLNATAPSGTYTLAVTTFPPDYIPQPSALIPVCTNTATVAGAPDPALIQAQDTAPAGANTVHDPATCPASTAALAPGNQGTTQYFTSFAITVPGSANVLNNHIPLDPFGANVLAITKTGSASVVELGDSLQYTVAVRNRSAGPLSAVTVVDTLPAGFRYIPGTTRIGAVAQADPGGGVGPVLTFNLGNMAASSTITITYRVRVAVGAQQGNGINRAQARSGAFASNTAQWRVRVTGGVFTSEACVLGKIFVDCNGNHVQDAEELGIPGVRLYFQDGSYLVSDVEGKYSVCNLLPRTHVLKVDPSTLPRGSRLTTSSNRNAGDANSLFLDLRNGELHRADFIEGGCAAPVLEQVKARRRQGEVVVPRVEKPPSTGGPPLRFESQPRNLRGGAHAQP